MRELLRRCLQSIAASDTGFGVEVIVVDNVSADGTAEMVERDFSAVRLVRSPRNGGYAYGNNIGLSFASGDYWLLLNPDTELPPQALQAMVDLMDRMPQLGAAGPKLVRADGSLDLACRRSFPSPEVSLYRMLGLSKVFPHSRRFARYNLTYLDPDEPTFVDSVVGAFMLLRRTAMEQVGLLDESFFMYGEDLDLAYRLRQAGWLVYYYPQVVVLHHKGESSKQRRLGTEYEFYRAMLLFYNKHYKRRYPVPVTLAVYLAVVLRGGLMMAKALVGRVRRV